MDNNDSRAFYTRKAAILNNLCQALEEANNESWGLIILERAAPGGDVAEIQRITSPLTEAIAQTNILLDAVKAMLT